MSLDIGIFEHVDELGEWVESDLLYTGRLSAIANSFCVQGASLQLLGRLFPIYGRDQNPCGSTDAIIELARSILEK